MSGLVRSLAKRMVPYPAYRVASRAYHSLRRTGRYYDDGYRLDFFGYAFKALTFNGIDGDYFEFGCWMAKTFHSAYASSRKHAHACHLYALDSFCGLPPSSLAIDDHPKWIAGSMSNGLDKFNALCQSRGIPKSAYTTVSGFYSESLSTPQAAALPKNIAFAYVDCDLYTSTVDVLRFLGPRLKHGMILAFDDYYCWSATADSGERAAFMEFAAANPNWLFVPWLKMPWGGQSFVVFDAAKVKRGTPGLIPAC